MLYFDILPNDIIFILFVKLDYRSSVSLSKSSGASKKVYEDTNRWKFMLIKTHPDIYTKMSKIKHYPSEYRSVYYYYDRNVEKSRLLLNEADAGTVGLTDKNRLCDYPKILRKLWLYSAYGYAYPMLTSIAGNDSVDYDQFKIPAFGTHRWHDILDNIKLVEAKGEYHPDYVPAMVYLKTGQIKRPQFDNWLYVLNWMLMIDPNLEVICNYQYIRLMLNRGLVLKHVEGIKIFLNTMSSYHLSQLYTDYKLPPIADEHKCNVLIRHITEKLL